MLPRFAAIVCSTTCGTIKRSCPTSFNRVRPNGTKAIKATSFVMTMLNRKGKKTRRNSMARVVWILLSRRFAIQTKKLAFCKPFVIAIKLNKSASVSQSI